MLVENDGWHRRGVTFNKGEDANVAMTHVQGLVNVDDLITLHK